MLIELHWSSDGVDHVDRRVVPPRARPVLGPDWPADHFSGLVKERTGEYEAVLNLATEPAWRADVTESDLGEVLRRGLEPRCGLHLPSRWLRGSPAGCGPVARCLGPIADGGGGGEGWRFDFNHPLAGRDITVRIDVDAEAAAPVSGSPGMPMASPLRTSVLDAGVGLQAWRDEAPLRTQPDDYRRQDETPDDAFYAIPRLVHHIDASARAHIGQIYAAHIRPGSRVLDLMTSWVSHLPDDFGLAEVIGLGMNREELLANPRLDAFEVNDLNRDQSTGFAKEHFDAVICTVSFEYLIDPISVLRELRRVLRPGGKVILTFSNRCFPTKAIAIWNRIHEFERQALAVYWFLEAGGYEGLRTESIIGYPRPADDPYAGQNPLADPVYAVIAAHAAD